MSPSKYTSLLFTQRCSVVGIEVSNGSRGDCFDNAVMESFHASLKKDLIHRRSWPTKTEARTAMFEYIETFYNRRRRHSRLAMLSPVDYENAAHTRSGKGAASRRLAETSNINYNTPSTATKAAQRNRVHRTGGGPTASFIHVQRTRPLASALNATSQH